MSRFLRGILGLALILIVSACDDEARAEPLSRPSGYHPEWFPDIPLPAGFAPDAAHDQLAVVIAGGQIRRFDVALVAKDGHPDGDAAAALTRWRTTLPGLGWDFVASTGDSQRWRRRNATRVGEELLIASGRTGGRPTIRLRISPLPDPVSP